MTDPTVPPRDRLTGTRIRDRRLAIGMKQADLAAAAGISASYLNLIEHNRRRIGGKLLIALARALQADPSALSDGASVAMRAALNAAADAMAAAGPEAKPPETDRIDELAARFPGWTGLIAAQADRIADLRAALEGLSDRLTHDPALADAMHDMLSSVAAIRSTSEILAADADLDPAWRGRFHRNLLEEAQRLSRRTTGFVGQLQVPAGGVDAVRPMDQAEAAFDAAGHCFPAIETGGAAGIDTALATLPDLTDAARAVARRWLTDYAQDAQAMPLARIEAALAASGGDPAPLLAADPPRAGLILRRLSALPPRADRRAFGLAVIDGAGGLIFRKRADGFTLPRHGDRCPRWPIYRALARPGQPDTGVVSLPGQGFYRVWTVSQPVPASPVDLGTAPMLTAAMLVRRCPDDAPHITPDPLIVGPDCPTCRAAAAAPDPAPPTDPAL